MKLVERMIHDPMRCLGCGMGNVPDGVTGEIGPFIDLEQEVGWNDHAYLCTDCGAKAGAFAGMVSADEAKDLERSIRNQHLEIHELRSELEDTSRRLRGTQKKLLRV